MARRNVETKDRQYYLGLGENTRLRKALYGSDPKSNLCRGQGVIELSHLKADGAWAAAKDAVNFHVELVTALYAMHTGEYFEDDTPVMKPFPAIGQTAGGSDKNIRLVVVDKLRTGHYRVLDVVSEKYETFHLVDVYSEFRRALEQTGEAYHLDCLRVSGNAGIQDLVVEFERGFKAPRSRKEEVRMKAVLKTSIDASRVHSLEIYASIKNVDTEDGEIDINLGALNRLSSKHTKNLTLRASDFFPKLEALLSEWDSKVVPVMHLMYDNEFDEETLAAIVQKAVEKTELSQIHAGKGRGNEHEGMQNFYRHGEIRSSARHNTLAKVQAACYQYLDDKLESIALRERVRPQLAKALDKEFEKVSPEYKKLKS